MAKVIKENRPKKGGIEDLISKSSKFFLFAWIIIGLSKIFILFQLGERAFFLGFLGVLIEMLVGYIAYLLINGRYSGMLWMTT